MNNFSGKEKKSFSQAAVFGAVNYRLDYVAIELRKKWNGFTKLFEKKETIVLPIS